MAVMGDMFPADFLWGAATAGYQVEGDIGNNDWDVFTSDAAIHARVAALGTLASPPEHFRLRPAGPAVHHANLHVLQDDLDRCRALGMNAYRFSVEWSRIEPHPGDWRADVLEHYSPIFAMRNGLTFLTVSHNVSQGIWTLCVR
jgi:beta-glucosidase